MWLTTLWGRKKNIWQSYNFHTTLVVSQYGQTLLITSKVSFCWEVDRMWPNTESYRIEFVLISFLNCFTISEKQHNCRVYRLTMITAPLNNSPIQSHNLLFWSNIVLLSHESGDKGKACNSAIMNSGRIYKAYIPTALTINIGLVLSYLSTAM